MKIILTGATGFLGSAIYGRLLDQGHEVYILARKSSKVSSLEQEAFKRETVAKVLRYEDIISSFEQLVKIQPDLIIHSACNYGSNRDLHFELVNTNIMLGVGLIDSILAAKIARRVTFLNISSALPSDVSFYALSKNQFKQWGSKIAIRNPENLLFLNLNLQQMYGPGDKSSRFIPRIIREVTHNVRSVEMTHGDQLRDFVYIDDVVKAIECVLKQIDFKSPYEEIDVGSGGAVSLKQFVITVKRLAKSDTDIKFGAIPCRPYEPMTSVADVSKLKTYGWTPVYDLEAGINATIKWVKDNSVE